MTSPSPGSRPIEPILWLKVFLDSRLQYESTEGSMDFIAFLVQTLRQNRQKLIRGIPTGSPGDYYMISGLLAITLAPERQEVDLRLYRFISQPRIQPKFEPHCPGDDVIKEKPKNSRTYSNPDEVHRKSQTQISKFFFSVQTTRLQESFEGLNSSLA